MNVCTRTLPTNSSGKEREQKSAKFFRRTSRIQKLNSRNSQSCSMIVHQAKPGRPRVEIPPPLRIVTRRLDDLQKKRPQRVRLRQHREIQLRSGNGSNGGWGRSGDDLAAVPMKTAAERAGMVRRRTEAPAFGGGRIWGHGN